MTETRRKVQAASFVLHGAPERDADVYFATGFLAPDPILCLGIKGRRVLLVSDLELFRARQQASRVDRVLSLSKEMGRLTRRSSRASRPTALDVVAALLRAARVRRVDAPSTLPLGTADGLRKRGIRVVARPGAFFPERVSKSEPEVRAITEAVRATADAIEDAVDHLRRSRIRKDRLVADGGAVVTSESVKARVTARLLERDHLALNTIVACGIQGCDPHERGHGPLQPHRTIVIDVFPRGLGTLYHGDLTRTVVRGRASAEARAIHAAVRRAQERAIGMLRTGVEGGAVHQAVLDSFAESGYRTRVRKGRPEGFFHGTGHGLGLELHEEPRLSTRAGPLPDRSVVTIEPGLYYPQLGAAVRIEDVALVTRDGPRVLSRLDKDLEI